MENKFKRFLALALALFMVISMMPMQALAAEGDPAAEPQTHVEGCTLGETHEGVPYEEDNASVYTVVGFEALCGSMWNPSDSNNVMTDNGDGTFSKTFQNVAVSDGYQLKVVESTADGEDTWYGTSTNNNVTFDVSSVCDVTVTIDAVTKKITVTGSGVEKVAFRVDSVIAVGNGDGTWLNGVTWDPTDLENKMTEVSTGVYEITYSGVEKSDNYQVKFAANQSWRDNWGGVYAGSGVKTEAEYNGSESITIDVPYDLATVTLRLDLTGYDSDTEQGATFTVTVTDEKESVDPAPAHTYVAQIGDTKYETLEEALKAVTDNCTIKLLEDITISDQWDCRSNGAKITASNVTIDGQGHTLKLTGEVKDNNWNTVFRFEQAAVVQNLTIDVSEATGVQRSISAKLSLDVINCTFIGNGTTAKRAIIYGEGAGTAISDVEVQIILCTFKNWSYGVSDNQNGQDARYVDISNCEFENANVLVSASDNVYFDNNTMDGGYVNISSYTVPNKLVVRAMNTKVDNTKAADNKIVAKTINNAYGFQTPVAEVEGKLYITLADAIKAADGKTITLLKDIALTEGVTIPAGKDITLDLNGKTVSMSVAATETSALITNNGNLTIKDSAVGGKLTYVSSTVSTSYSTSTIINNGTLTVESGTIENTSARGGAPYAIDSSNTLTVNGGKITATYTTAIRQVQSGSNDNTVTVTGGTISGGYAGLQVHVFSNAKKTTTKITGGTFKGTYAFYTTFGNATASSNTEIEVSGGTFDGDVYLDNNNNGSDQYGHNVSITGGTFLNWIFVYTKDADGNQVPVKAITGGTFHVDPSLEYPAYNHYNYVADGYKAEENADGTYGVSSVTKVTVTVQDATVVEGNAYPKFTYTTDVEVPALDITYTVDGTIINATVAEMKGYEFTVVSGKLTVEKALVRVYAKNNANAKYFAELKDAIAFAAEQKGNVPVYLLGNITISETIVINDTNAGLIELQGEKTGGQTLTLTSTHSGEMFRLEKGTLAVKNLKINAQGDAFYVTGGTLNLNYHSVNKQFIEVTSQTYSCIYIRGGNVNVNGAKLTSLGEYPAIQGNGNYAGNVTLTKWNIGDGTYPVVSAPNSDMAIYWPGNGKLTIEGGDYTGDTAVYAKSGTITINGGTFIGNGAKADYVANNNGATATGDAVVIETSSNPDYETPVVEITGGTFTSVNAQPIAVYGAGTAVKKFVSGGTFNKDLDNKVVAEGKATVETESGVWTIVDGVAYIEKDGEKVYYATLAEAIAAAKAGQTVWLMKDVTVEKSIGITGNRNVVIDLNGHTLSSAMAHTITCYYSNTTITIKDSVGGGKVLTTGSGKHAFVVQSNLVIDGAEISSDKGGNAIVAQTANANVTIQNDAVINGKVVVKAGTLTITGGTFTDKLEITTGVKVEISAGSFKYPVQAEWCAEGYMPCQHDDGTYGVMEAKEAAIGNTYYATLAEAIEAAKDGETVTLMRNISVDSDDLVDLDGYHTFFKVEGKSITIDLNGKTVYADASAVTDQFVVGVFSTANNGHLTLKDSSEQGTGTVQGYSGANQEAAYLDPAKENTDYNYKFYSLLAVYDDDCSITVKGGNYILDYAGDSLAYTSCNEGIVVNGGTFKLGNLGGIRNGMPWVFNARGQNIRHVVVNGGTFCADIQHQYYPFEVEVPNTKALKNENGMYTVVDAVAYVTEREWSSAWYTNEVGYATLEEAIAACEGPKTKSNKTSEQEVVVLLKDIELEDTITIPAGKSVVLDLNGKNITMESAVAVSMITNKGSLTINGTGKIAYTFNGTPSTAVAANTIENRGVLVVNGGEISNTGTGNQIGYGIDNINGSTLTVKGGKITATGSSYYDGIRLMCGSNDTTVTVNGGEISSIWAQNPSTNKEREVKGTVVINGGTVNTTYYENYTTVKVAEGATATVTPYGAGSNNTTSAVVDGYTVYSFVH